MLIKTIPVKGVFAPIYSIWYALPSGHFSVGDEDRVDSRIERELQWPFKTMKQLKYFIKLQMLDKNTLDGEEKIAIDHTLKTWPINHQAKILTPFGTVKVNHDEFNVIDFNSYLDCIDNGSFQVKFLTKGKSHKNTARNQLLYIRSRGISLSSALGMVSGLVKSQNTLYMLPHPEYQKMFLSYYERYAAEQLKFKEEKIKRDKDNLSYFFDEEEALVLNIQANR